MRRYLTFRLGPSRIPRGGVPKGTAERNGTVEHVVALIRAGAQDFSVRQKAMDILLERRVKVKDYQGEIEALLEWVQQNIRDMKDPFRPEVLQSARRTLESRAGGRENMAILLGSMCEATGHPVRLVLAGSDPLRPRRFTHARLEGYCQGRWIPLDPTVGLPRSESANRLDEHGMLRNLSGPVREEPSAPQQSGLLGGRGDPGFTTGRFERPEPGMAVPIQTFSTRVPPGMWRPGPIGRPVPFVPPHVWRDGSSPVRRLRPVRSGRAYCITSPPGRGLVMPELAMALESVFERFARERGFTPEQPLEIRLSRGFRPGSPGHGEGRAADIAAVGGKSLLEWKQEWDRAMAAAGRLSDPQQRAEAHAAEQRRNVGYGLYRFLHAEGGWLVDPEGWRPYRGVTQLFGPWTATEGPWKPMQIKVPNPYQRQRLADQQWVFQAHQNHIHVAR